VPYRNKGVKPQTRERIKRDIQANGIRNPILVYNDPEHGFLLGFGGGRVFACQELNLAVPAIVNDWSAGQLWNFPEVTMSNYHEYFTDVPINFCATDIGLDYHYNLESAREGDIDPGGVEWCSPEDMEIVRKESPWMEKRGG
jgi:hypothetical protein